MFDLDNNKELKWNEFKDGLDKCMTKNAIELDNFLFDFFNISGYIDL